MKKLFILALAIVQSFNLSAKGIEAFPKDVKLSPFFSNIFGNNEKYENLDRLIQSKYEFNVEKHMEALIESIYNEFYPQAIAASKKVIIKKDIFEVEYLEKSHPDVALVIKKYLAAQGNYDDLKTEIHEDKIEHSFLSQVKEIGCVNSNIYYCFVETDDLSLSRYVIEKARQYISGSTSPSQYFSDKKGFIKDFLENNDLSRSIQMTVTDYYKCATSIGKECFNSFELKLMAYFDRAGDFYNQQSQYLAALEEHRQLLLEKYNIKDEWLKISMWESSKPTGRVNLNVYPYAYLEAQNIDLQPIYDYISTLKVSDLISFGSKVDETVMQLHVQKLEMREELARQRRFQEKVRLDAFCENFYARLERKAERERHVQHQGQQQQQFQGDEYRCIQRQSQFQQQMQ